MIKLEELKAVYSQEGDTVGGEEWQELEIETADGGGGAFYVLKTERWAIEKPEEISEIIKDFDKRFKLKSGNIKHET